MAEHRGGRPISASQRPTGGDKAHVSRKQFFRRKKIDRLSVEKIDYVDYKNVRMLSQFVSDQGRIIPRRITGLCAANQRRLKTAVMRARNIALLPFARGE